MDVDGRRVTGGRGSVALAGLAGELAYTDERIGWYWVAVA